MGKAIYKLYEIVNYNNDFNSTNLINMKKTEIYNGVSNNTKG